MSVVTFGGEAVTFGGEIITFGEKMTTTISTAGQYGNISAPPWTIESFSRPNNTQNSGTRISNIWTAGVDIVITKMYWGARTNNISSTTQNIPRIYSWNQSLDSGNGQPENRLNSGIAQTIDASPSADTTDLKLYEQVVSWTILAGTDFIPTISNVGGVGYRLAGTGTIGTEGQRSSHAATDADPWVGTGTDTADVVLYFDIELLSPQAPVLETEYIDLINLDGDVVAGVDLRPNISGDTAIVVTWVPAIPNGLSEFGGVVSGTITTPTGTAIATVEGKNEHGSVIDTFQWTTLTTGDPSTGINVPINEA